ncbi:MAG: zinc ABC transporter substrate-binding protein [Rhodospirillaceae bacterium]|nr:MAG: zinc ABC transporter substrate-binding protein [Rhodospirillaceae bacterium]
MRTHFSRTDRRGAGRHWRAACLCVLLATGLASPALAGPHVVASIKPVHALVAGVMTGVGAPDLLVTGGASPHTYSLKPSDAEHLNQADIVFWIGPNLENFLGGPLTALASRAKIIALIDAPGIVVRPARESGVWEPHDDARPESGAVVAAREIDGHIWLDPMNARAMVAAITATLVEADPANAARYSMNASALATRLDGLDADIMRTVAPVKAKPFIVFHDAYQYFQERYGVNAVGAVTISPDRPPGARRVVAVKDKIAELGAACVFAEPQFEPNLIRMLVEGTHAKTGVLDPEGATLDAGPELYFVLMRGIADHLVACLGP